MTTHTDLLAFESRQWLNLGTKEQAIRNELGITAVQYYVGLREAMSNPVAIAAHPATVAKLRRILNQRMQGRSSARWAG